MELPNSSSRVSSDVAEDLPDPKSTRPIHTSFPNTTAMNSSLVWIGQIVVELKGPSELVRGGVGRWTWIGRAEERRMFKGS